MSQEDSTQIIPNGYKIKISRKRTQITTYENMQLHTTKPVKAGKPKKIKPSIPSDYAGFNYYNRMKQRRSAVKEICYNNFDLPNVVMITLTFDQTKSTETSYTDLQHAHYEFKKFIQRVNSHYDNFRYLATFNRQTNGNWHYHVFCNFPQNISLNIIKQLWGKGLVYVTRIKTRADYETGIKYLVNNMDNSADDLKSKHGFLYSKNCERDIVYTSWRKEDEAGFEESFEKVANAPRRILYETKNALGIKGQTVNTDTGEISEYHIPDRTLTPILQEAGYEEWNAVYTHLSSSADFSDKFQPLVAATPKRKKWKVKKRN